MTAVTSLPRVCFFIFHYERGLVLKIVFDKKNLVHIFSHFFIFHFRALLTEEMEKEHAHINGGGCAKLATCSPLSYFCLENVHISYFFFQIASARAHYTCAFIPTCAKTWPTPRSAHTPQTMLAPRRHTLFLSFAAHSLHPPSPLSSHV